MFPSSSSSSTSSYVIDVPTPTTTLPNDPRSLRSFIRQRHLSTLRKLYERKTLKHLHYEAEQASKRRSIRDKVRHGLGLTEQDRIEPIESLDSNTKVAAAAAEEEEEEELDSKVLEKELIPITQAGIDTQSHAYDFTCDLSPNRSSDTYYHGPHPPPPSKIVKSLLRITKSKPFFDPTDLPSTSLEKSAQDLFDSESSRFSPALSSNRSTEQTQRTSKSIEEWENEIIASFSANCNERIGDNLARLNQFEREVVLGLRDQERFALGSRAAAATSASTIDTTTQNQDVNSGIGPKATTTTTSGPTGAVAPGGGAYSNWR